MSEKTEADLDLLHLSPAKDELFAAVRTIKQFCEKSDGCGYCDGYAWCVAMRQGGGLNTPNHWPDPEEGGWK